MTESELHVQGYCKFKQTLETYNLINLLMVINAAIKVSSSFAYMYQSLQGLSLKELTR